MEVHMPKGVYERTEEQLRRQSEGRAEWLKKRWSNREKKRVSKSAKELWDEGKEALMFAGRDKWWAENRPTHCPKGHEYTKENSVILTNPSHRGKRRCRKCLNEKKRRAHFRVRYGITIEQRDAMLREQGGCAICQCTKPQGFGSGDWHVDHDHAKGTDKRGPVRGILCARCNLLLGMLKDDLWFIKRITEYLVKHRAVQYNHPSTEY